LLVKSINVCARYTLRRLDIAQAVFAAFPPPGYEEFSERARFNVAPRQMVPIVRTASDGRRVLDLAEWGLMPAWAMELKARPVNARAETVATNRMFRQALDRRRCLIPADGFYEWNGAKPPRQPYFIHLKDDGIFAFAGLWEQWRSPTNDEPLETCTIITTTPNDLMRPIHDRMPVILDRPDYDQWLDRNAGGADVANLLRPFPAASMEAYSVSTAVNSVKNDGPKLVQRKEITGQFWT
jgi:putative SOS response-associated peptidase YedK